MVIQALTAPIVAVLLAISIIALMHTLAPRGKLMFIDMLLVDLMLAILDSWWYCVLSGPVRKYIAMTFLVCFTSVLWGSKALPFTLHTCCKYFGFFSKIRPFDFGHMKHHSICYN